MYILTQAVNSNWGLTSASFMTKAKSSKSGDHRTTVAPGRPAAIFEAALSLNGTINRLALNPIRAVLSLIYWMALFIWHDFAFGQSRSLNLKSAYRSVILPGL